MICRQSSQMPGGAGRLLRSSPGCLFGNKKKNGPQWAIHFAIRSVEAVYSGWMFAACLPFGPCFTSKLTF